MTTYTLDATNKAIGRVASEAAKLLAGKGTPDYKRNEVASVKVVITNAGKVRTSAKKSKQTRFNKYSGYPGGLRSLSLAQVIEKSGHKEAVRKAVYGMLPINKLRTKIMKNVSITE